MIYLLHGPDDFSMREALRKLVRAALPAEDTADMNTTRLPAASVTLDALRFACEALPFLADRRVAIVEQLFSTPRLAAVAKEVAAYLANVPENTLLVFVEPSAPPKSGPIAKALDEAGIKLQAFPTLAGSPLQRWIKQRAKDAGATFTDAAAETLAASAAGDLRALSHEIDKLVAYAGPSHQVDAPDVRLLVHQAQEATMFDLVDAMAVGNRSRALAALHTLSERGQAPQVIMGMVARQVRLLLQAKDAASRGESPEVVGRLLGLPPFPTRKVLEQARLFTLAQLYRMHRRVLETDVASKTGQQDASLALEVLVTELAAQAGQSATPQRRSRR